MFTRKKEIEELKHISLLNDVEIGTLRQQFKILVIDDEDFEPIEVIAIHNFHITHKRDIDTIYDVAAYDIILCDTRGIGKAYRSEFEGAYLIKEIRANFPRKIIVAYTASSYDPSYNEYLAEADHVQKKGTLGEDWVEVLDHLIRRSINPIEQWKKVREELLGHDVSLSTVRKLEDKYVGLAERVTF